MIFLKPSPHKWYLMSWCIKLVGKGQFSQQWDLVGQCLSLVPKIIRTRSPLELGGPHPWFAKHGQKCRKWAVQVNLLMEKMFFFLCMNLQFFWGIIAMSFLWGVPSFGPGIQLRSLTQIELAEAAKKGGRRKPRNPVLNGLSFWLWGRALLLVCGDLSLHPRFIRVWWFQLLAKGRKSPHFATKKSRQIVFLQVEYCGTHHSTLPHCAGLSSLNHTNDDD